MVWIFALPLCALTNSTAIECLVVRRSCLLKEHEMRIVKIVCVSAILLCLVPHVSSTSRTSTLSTETVLGANETKRSLHVDWEPVMNAIIQVESEGNARAVNGEQVGAMQIMPITVKDCNNILKSRKLKKRYTLDDRFSVKKSKEMFLLIQSHYNPRNDVEQAIRAWNGGPQYSKRHTQRYYERVMSEMK